MRKHNKIKRFLPIFIIAAGLVALGCTVHFAVVANPSIGVYLLDADYQNDPLISR